MNAPLYSGTSPCGHPTYGDTMLLLTLFLGSAHGVYSIISFTTVDTPQLLKLFVWLLGVHISEVLLYIIICGCNSNGWVSYIIKSSLSDYPQAGTNIFLFVDSTLGTTSKWEKLGEIPHLYNM